MYCTNCGSKIDSDAIFCTNCGQSCGRQTANTTNLTNQINQSTNMMKEKINESGIVSFALNAIKHPISSLKTATTLPTNSLILTTVIATLLIPIVNVSAVRLFAYNIFSKLMSAANAFEGGFTDPRELAYMKQEFNQVIDMYMPFGKMFTANLLFQLVFFGLIAVVIYFYSNSCKNETFSKDNFIKVLATALVVDLAFVVLAAVALAISVNLSLFINLCNAIVIVCILFNGFKSMITSVDSYLYVFGVTTAFAFGFANYVCIKYFITSLIPFMGMMF